MALTRSVVPAHRGRPPSGYPRGARPRRQPALRSGPARSLGLVLAAAVAMVVVPAVRGDASAAADCQGDTGIPASALDGAARVGTVGGLRTGVAVMDTETGGCLVAGDTEGTFATASVVKVMIAARLLADGTMSGRTEDQARSMITRSDDAAADVLWHQTGGPKLEPWIEKHYDLPDLGSPNAIPGRWGNTQVSALGLAQLYAALREDPVVWPWLGAALHDMQTRAEDGTDQVFGLSAVAPSAAVKQGWGNGSADDPDNAVVNSTGYVAGDRYVVVLLTEGEGNVSECDSRGFHAGQAAVVTAMSRELLPSLTG